MRDFSIPGLDYPEHLGSYRLVRELGRGATGTVFLAYQEMLERDLAIKVLSPALTNDEAFVERFRREARVAAKLRHNHIAQVFDAGVQDGLYYIVMEYLGSRNLHQLLVNGRLTLAQSLSFIDHLLRALDYAHAHGIVHRDVKPANILVSDTDEATLTDFSIAHIKSGQKLTQTGTMLGTPEYMAPEQFEGKGIDGRADLYSAGVILYECLTGERPFRGESTPEIMKAHFFHTPQLSPEVPAALAACVLKALEKDPSARYQSAEEMRQALVASGGGAAESTLEQFLAGVTSGRISLDEANLAREKVKLAIDRGYKKALTVMMVDLAGSSKLKQPGETLIADRAFRDYRTSINGVLKDFGCTSFDWSGDGAICIFQHPLPAVQAALTIQGLVHEVAARHPHLPAHLLARIGVNTGDVYLDPRRGLGEFASRTVDQAGHLEKDCPAGEVHVSQATMELTQEQIAYAPVGPNRDQVMVFRALPAHEVPDDERRCSNCRLPLPEDARFCSGCGAASVEMLPTLVGPANGTLTVPPVETSFETGVELLITNARGTRRAALNRREFRVGSDPESDLVLPAEFLLSHFEGGVVLSSAGGLRVNGRPAFRRILRAGDELEAGEFRITLQGLPATVACLEGGQTLIPLSAQGCLLGSDLCPDPSVARQHASLRLEGGVFWVRTETGSRVTLVNGEVLKQHQSRTLQPYDVIQLGGQRLRFFDALPELGALACLDLDVRPLQHGREEVVNLVMQTAVEAFARPLPFLGTCLAAWFATVEEAFEACQKLARRLPPDLDYCLAVWAGELAVDPSCLRAVAEPLDRVEELARAGRLLGAQLVSNSVAHRLTGRGEPLGALEAFVLELHRVA